MGEGKKKQGRVRDIKREGKKKSYESRILFSLRELREVRVVGDCTFIWPCSKCVLMPCWSCSFHSWKLTNKKNMPLDNSPLRSCGAVVGLCLPKVLLPLMEWVALSGCIVLCFFYNVLWAWSSHGFLTIVSPFSVDIHTKTWKALTVLITFISITYLRALIPHCQKILYTNTS